MTSKLTLDQGAVLLARELARRAGEPVTQLAHTHTTVSIERAVLRLGGLDGADPGGMPWVNRLTDAVREWAGLEHGVALPVWDALHAGGYRDLRTLAEAAATGQAVFRIPAGRAAMTARELAVRSISAGLSVLDRQRAERARMTDDLADSPFPWVYLTVGADHADQAIAQAQAAARDGADVIAVIRSAGQALLDYVPAGVTREGATGTYATRENFLLMPGRDRRQPRRGRPASRRGSGFGHGLELNPAGPDSFLIELAQAQLVRELFPGAPLKYMPPTTRVTEDALAGCLLDAFFNLAGLMTDQSILCVGLGQAGSGCRSRRTRSSSTGRTRCWTRR